LDGEGVTPKAPSRDAPTDYGVWGTPAENGFSAFQASQNVSRYVCRKLTSC